MIIGYISLDCIAIALRQHQTPCRRSEICRVESHRIKFPKLGFLIAQRISRCIRSLIGMLTDSITIRIAGSKEACALSVLVVCIDWCRNKYVNRLDYVIPILQFGNYRSIGHCIVKLMKHSAQPQGSFIDLRRSILAMHVRNKALWSEV